MYKHIQDKRLLLMFEFVLKLPLHRTAFTHFLADFSMHIQTLRVIQLPLNDCVNVSLSHLKARTGVKLQGP